MFPLILEGEEGEKESKRHSDVRGKHQSVASHVCPKQDQTRNLGMCPDQESNWQPFSAWNEAPTN